MFHNIPPEPAPAPKAKEKAPPLIDAAFAYADKRWAAGASLDAIFTELVQSGFGEEIAEHVVRDLQANPPAQQKSAKRRRGKVKSVARSDYAIERDIREALKSAGRRNMIFGAMWCIGGLIVTLASMAASQGGGVFVIAWGAILFGAIQFIRGASQASNS